MALEGYSSPIIASLRERFRSLVRPPEFDDSLQPRKKPTSLVYGVDDNPPLLVRWAAALQHVFLMSVAWLYVVVLVNAVGGTADQSQDLIRMSMIAAGVATILQAAQGILGSGYLCPLSSSLTYLPSSILAVRTGGFSLLLGMAVLVSLVISAQEHSRVSGLSSLA
jgi:xanthine/uracil permease